MMTENFFKKLVNALFYLNKEGFSTVPYSLAAKQWVDPQPLALPRGAQLPLASEVTSPSRAPLALGAAKTPLALNPVRPPAPTGTQVKITQRIGKKHITDELLALIQ